MPHVIQPASTGRSKCRGCGKNIAAGLLRFGEVVPNPFAEGDTTQWYHVDCAALKRPEPFLEAVGERAEQLPDAERLTAVATEGVAHKRLSRVDGAERDPSGRAKCRSCHAVIPKGAWRVKLVFYEEGRFVPAGSIHAYCATAYFETPEILARIRHFTPDIGDDDLKELDTRLHEPSPPPAPAAAPAPASE